MILAAHDDDLCSANTHRSHGRIVASAAPGPENLLDAQAFTHLRQTCGQLYPTAGSKDALSFALHHVLRAFGLPCGLPSDKQHLSLSTEDAAYRLNQAFRNTQTPRIHLCPFDCADTLSPLAFGPASVRTLTASELETLVNLPQLQRNYGCRECRTKGRAPLQQPAFREKW